MGKKFGNLPSGQTATIFTISSGPYVARFTDLGATWLSLLAPDRNGTLEDVVLGFDTPEDYLTQEGCLGAVVGRNANRTAGAAFPLGEHTVGLGANEGPNNLHSGPDFWFHRLWTVEEEGADHVTFGLDTPHGDQGYPGAGHVSVTYRLEGSCLTVVYRGQFDRDTVFNPTQHVYLNLAGHDRGEGVLGHLLQIHGERFTPVGPDSIPTGCLAPVEGTVLDFRSPGPLSQATEADPLLTPQRGLDHNFVLTQPGLEQPAAILREPESGRTLTVFTTCPGLQVYTANYLDTTGKGGARYAPKSGVCLETQFFPNCLNNPHWPQPVVSAGMPVARTTLFAFGVQ